MNGRKPGVEVHILYFDANAQVSIECRDQGVRLSCYLKKAQRQGDLGGGACLNKLDTGIDLRENFIFWEKLQGDKLVVVETSQSFGNCILRE